MIAAVNAGGELIPLKFVFPRVNFKDVILAGAFAGSIGGVNPSGWSNVALFCVKPSKDCPAILLPGNSENHIQIPVIELSRKQLTDLTCM
ncbi:hypothetical protein HHI36_020614 [Cryptolaemus montrouzieri]|uniref:Uncharacterized protein n=1 Tax=Cryptolaemus montrouzieri TaxID=559131 RepID=A0ABD2NCF4_9CUCU